MPSPLASSPASGSRSCSKPSPAETISATTPQRRISSDHNQVVAGSSRNPDGLTQVDAPAPLAGKRSRSGCLTCRKRKKKCDETLCEETGGCWRCRNAGYQCEGFRRPPVVFEPGSASFTKAKRTKRSPAPESLHGRNHDDSRVKTEGDSNGHGNGSVEAQSSFTPPLATRSAPFQAAMGQVDQESLDMAHSLAEFAGLATSSASWPLANDMTHATSHNSPPKDDRTASHLKDRASSSIPASYSSFAHPSIGSHRSTHQTQMQPPSPSPSPSQPPPQPQSLHSTASLQTSSVPCEIVGDCLFSGHNLCASCSAVASRLMQPDLAQLAALDAGLVQVVQPMPSLYTPPMGSRHGSPAADHAKSKLVMESLIGYYSTLITCWVQGCDVRGIEASTLFRRLVPYLLESVDRHPPLRLSIAAVTAGYVGGARLTWPKDVVAIHQWANTLRADRTSIADCVKANLSFTFPSTPDTLWSVSPGATGLSSESHNAGVTALSPANAERLRRASTTHATLDDLLVGQAQTLKQLALRSLEQAVSDHRAKTTRAAGLSLTEKGFLAECAHVNPLLMTALNIAIYSFAEEGMQSYFEEAARMRSLIDTLLGSFPPVNLSKLTSHEHLGFRTYVWSDVTTAIACGTRPHLQLSLSTYVDDGVTEPAMSADGGDVAEALAQDQTFILHDSMLAALSDIARLRHDFDGGDFTATARRAAGSPVPQWVHDRARRIQARVEACKIDGPPTTGSAICATMTKGACIVLIHTLIYRVGALHPVVKGLLRGMLELWTSAGEQYCRSVGCSNFNLAITIASSVAVDEEDRKVCEQAMQIVGHEEAGPASGRELIREVWRRTDVAGTPCFWTDLVASGEYAVAFF